MRVLTLVICLTLAARAISKDSRDKSAERRQQATWRMTATANRIFAHQLFTNIARKQKSGNILISPFTVSTALSMALLGAKDETAKELMDALGYNELGAKKNGQNYTQDDVPRLYKSFLGKMRKSTLSKGFMLRIASRLYGDSSEEFLDEFIQGTERYYGARLEQVQFGSDPDGSRDIINGWVSNKTEGMIDEALPDGSVTSDTLIVLVSSVFFQGTWQQQFDPSETDTGIFTTDEGEQVSVSYMHRTFNKVRYNSYNKLKTEVVILPYKAPDNASRIVMELYLPYTPEDLSVIEQAGLDEFHSAVKGATETQLDISLPKLRIKYTRDLRENLEDFGVETMFGAADLSGMNGKRNLNFGAVHHSTVMEIDEKGTKASGVTAITLTRSSSPPLIEFNHPFVVLIREIDSNSVLFMGRVANPVG